MEVLPLTSERKAELDEYAKRHGQDAATALDHILAAALEWERQDFQEAVEGGYEDFKAGRVRSLDDSIKALRVKHGLPG